MRGEGATIESDFVPRSHSIFAPSPLAPHPSFLTLACGHVNLHSVGVDRPKGESPCVR